MLNRLLITGADGQLGRALRDRLRPLARSLRLADLAPIGDAAPEDQVVRADLADPATVDAMVQGCDAILHLGGISVEAPFAPIMQANILGLYNLFEAARRHGQPRVFFASSNHTIGYYRQGQTLQADCPFRPDGLYGVSKVFGEALARMYFDKFGQETALVRIGSATPEPHDHRALSTWLSHDDLIALIAAVFKVPTLGCPVIWGVSRNDAAWWQNGDLDWLDWSPKDNAETFRAIIERTVPLPAPDDPLRTYQGGAFAATPVKD